MLSLLAFAPGVAAQGGGQAVQERTEPGVADPSAERQRGQIERADDDLNALLKRAEDDQQESLRRLQQQLQEISELGRKQRDESVGGQQEHMRELSERLQEQLDGLPGRIQERLDSRSQEPAPGRFSRDEGIASALSALGAFVVYSFLYSRLVRPLRAWIVRRIDVPATAKRWSTISAYGSLIALGLPVGYFFVLPDWPGRLFHADPYIEIAGRMAGLGFCLTLLCLLVHAHGLCRQRESDLLADALAARIAAGDGTHERFILYLRPFASTNDVKIRVPINYKSFIVLELEQQLSAAIRPLASFVGLGNSLEHFGAGRVSASESDWKESVARLARSAALIVLVPSSRPGTRWELEHLHAQDYIGKTVFIDLPKTLLTSRFQQAAEWDAVARLMSDHGYTWPADDPQGCVVFFGTSKSPQFTAPLDLRQIDSLTGTFERVLALCDSAAAYQR